MQSMVRSVFIFILIFNSCSSKSEDMKPKAEPELIFSLRNLTKESLDSTTISTRKVLPSHSVFTVQVSDIPNIVSFIVLQAHSFLYSVTLSYRKEYNESFYVNGTNIGLVMTSESPILFLMNPNSFNVSVMVAVTPYSKKAPIPGGCNMEFPTYTAPYLILNYSSALVTVDGQPAMAPDDVKSNLCGMNNLGYKMYQLYLTERDFSEDTYFKGIEDMLTPKSAETNGYLVKNSIFGPLLRYTFVAFRGTGSVFTLVVEDGDGSLAAYVPVHTFSCNNGYNIDSCQILSTTFSKFICAAVMFIGLFLCLTGHVYFEIELFIMGTMTGGILSYILLNLKNSAINGSTDFVVEATFIGIFAGIFWLLLWWFLKSPMVLVTIPIFNLGFLISCIIFFIGISDITVFNSDINYWLTLVSIALIFAFFLIIIPKNSNILSCSLIGGYATILPVDYYAGTNLKYILLNVIYRATENGFDLAKTKPPFQTPDVILVVVWGALAFCGLLCQLRLSSGKPPFPPPYRPFSSSPNNTSDLTTPLLAGRRHSQYSPGSDNVFNA